MSRFSQLIFLFLASVCFVHAESSWQLASPSENFKIAVAVKDFEGKKSMPIYSVTFQGKKIIEDSPLSLELKDGVLGTEMKVVNTTTNSHDSTWKPVLGENANIRDHYNELALQLSSAKYGLTITFRAYDEGVAFQYTITGNGEVNIRKEHSEFRFSQDHLAWVGDKAQCLYEQKHLSEMLNGCERPLVIQQADGVHIALAEANLVDYARMKFSPVKNVKYAVESELSGQVKATLPLSTPWRVIMAAENPRKLLGNNFIIPNLNAPCAIQDTSWIKPGGVLREATLTTVGGKECIDFCVQRGLKYILLDAGWYGYEFDPKADARAVNLDPKRKKGELDLPEVIRYGKEKGIGVILYVNRLALEKQLDEIIPLYEKWGVKGMKFGFVSVGTQQATSFVNRGIRLAAQHHIMVDVHDELRPTGYNRTYPNLMTTEGIKGDEDTPPPSLSVTNAFIRGIAGPADHTVCYYDKRVSQNWTHAGQLAKSIVHFGPWHSLFWYDRPSVVPSMAESPELEFWRDLPSIWDETHVLQGEIGAFIVTARRSGSTWYLGFLNAQHDRSINVPLNFLSKGKTYRAMICRDDTTMKTKSKVRVEEQTVTAEDTLTLQASAHGGGVAIRFSLAK